MPFQKADATVNLPTYGLVLIFAGSLACVIGGSVLISQSLRDIGKHLHLPEQFLGFLIALGSDSPEIASSLVAISSGQQDVGAGVIFGSNLFNLASLLGLAALIAGGIKVQRRTVLLNGSVGLLVTVLALALVSGWGSTVTFAVLILLIPIPYAAILWMRSPAVEALPLPSSWTAFLADASSDRSQGSETNPPSEAVAGGKNGDGGLSKPVVKTVAALVLIVGGSIALVRTTTSLTAGWLPHALLGPLVLAGLTGIPNVYTAIRLAMRHNGPAVVVEAMNSNILNVVAGLAIPALVFGGISLSGTGLLSALWLLALTVGAIALCVWRCGLSRTTGSVLIAGYLGFIAVWLWKAL